MPVKKRTGMIPPRIDLRSRISDDKEWLYGGEWVLVRSSNVHSLRYDSRATRLYVQFGGKKNKKSGGTSPISTYEYFDVSPGVAKRMFMSASMGRFVHEVLKKDGYRYRQLS